MERIVVVVRCGPETKPYATLTFLSLTKDPRVISPIIYEAEALTGSYEDLVETNYPDSTWVLVIDAGLVLSGDLPTPLSDCCYFREIRNKYSVHRVLLYRRRRDIVTTFDGIFRPKLRPNRRVDRSSEPYFEWISAGALNDHLAREERILGSIPPPGRISLSRSGSTPAGDRIKKKDRFTTYDRIHGAFLLLRSATESRVTIEHHLAIIEETTRSRRYRALGKYLTGLLAGADYQAISCFIKAAELDDTRPEYPAAISRSGWMNDTDRTSYSEISSRLAAGLKETMSTGQTSEHIFLDLNCFDPAGRVSPIRSS